MAEPTGWASFHLFYHADRDPLLVECVAPLAGALLRADAIDRFFFIRYSLGGPHIRLRLKVLPGKAEHVREAVAGRVDEFFARRPSVSCLAPAAIREENERIVLNDPHARDVQVFADNSCVEIPFEPEVERYGGKELLSSSLEFFAVSSLHSLALVADLQRHQGQKRLVKIAALLTRQAWGAARDLDELGVLFAYPTNYFTPGNPLLEKSDRSYEGQAASFVPFLLKLLDEAEGAIREAPVEPAGLEAAAHLLSLDSWAATPEVRKQIFVSQMHMTANRVGLKNLEELYVSRILSRALEDLLADPARRALLADRLERRSLGLRPPLSLDQSVDRSLRAMAARYLERCDE